MTIYRKTAKQLVEDIDSAPGRVVTFLTHLEQETTPHSCTRYEWNGDLEDLLRFCARALKGGSGIKVTFPTNTRLCTPRPLGEWKVWKDRESRTLDNDSGFEGDYSLVVKDSIEGNGGILDSMTRMIGYRYWSGLVLDLSNLRPQGTINSNGLIASGAESFVLIFEGIANYLETGTIENLIKLLGTLNSVMRRGGYKKGIITSAMSSDCHLIYDYLAVPMIEVDGSHKKGVILHNSAFDNALLIEKICDSRNNESTFIEKYCGKGLAFNVCNGLILGHKATCLIWRVNLGMCTIEAIRRAFKQAATKLCELHTTWRGKVPHLAAYYARLRDDRQIGLDVMGLANLLAIEGVTYQEFATALERLLNSDNGSDDEIVYSKAVVIANEIIEGYNDALKVCDEYMIDRNLPLLDRIFTVEPAQNHCYATVDRLGKTTCRGIFAPTGRVVKRTSDTQYNKRYFHGNVETDVMVGIELHEKVCDLWQQMMNGTGRAHGISQDTWSDTTAESLKEFMNRPSKTFYYSEKDNFDQRRFLSKTVQEVAVCDVTRKGECLACAE